MTITSTAPEDTPQDVRVTISGGPDLYSGPFDHRLNMAQDAERNWMIRSMDRWNVTDQTWESVVN